MNRIEPQTARTPRDTADYVERLARELRAIADQSNLGFLAYLLSMVEDDAAATGRRLADK